MDQRPPGPASRVSEFYERKRRLAYHFAWISMGLLLVQLSTGSVLEFYSHPRSAPSGDSVFLLHRCLSQDDSDGSRLLLLDPALKLQAEPLRLLDTASAVLPEGRELLVFYGSSAVLLSDLKTSKPIDLGQKWDVLAALADPARDAAWIFGWKDGKIVARRRDKGAWSSEIEISKSGLLERLTASIEPGTGPQVAWLEKGQTKVKTARWDSQAFVLHAEFEIGNAVLWDAVLSRGRTLVASYSLDDRSFEFVTFRIACCPGCASPVPPGPIAFTDPIFLVGRKVTGLSLAVMGDLLRFFVTRPSTIMSGAVPLSTLKPDSAGGRFVAITADPVWRKAVGSIAPLALVFCSISMVFIGVTLFRERGRALQQILHPVPGPAISSLPSRGMAYLLDGFLLLPVFIALIGWVDADDWEDPRFSWAGLLCMVAQFVYSFGMEWAFGWTIGKRILGMKVTELDGRRVTFRGALIRNLGRVIDGSPFGLVVAVGLMLRSPRRQRLGDLLGRTMVVQDLGPNP